jgi:hypothetical protein
MNRKIGFIALILFVFYATGTVFAQSRLPNAATFIQEMEKLVKDAENLATRTATKPTDPDVGKKLLKDLQKMEDDYHKLQTNFSYAEYNFTAAQDSKRKDLARRWDIALPQISRNVSRW